MDQELQKVIRQLQDEKCPPAVLERLTQRISREKPPTRSLRSILAWAVSIGFLLGTVVLLQWRAHHEAERAAAEIAAAQARANRALVVQQTELAFAYIGKAVNRAAAHTENVLLKEAVPPLRNGFETIKNKVNNPI